MTKGCAGSAKGCAGSAKGCAGLAKGAAGMNIACAGTGGAIASTSVADGPCGARAGALLAERFPNIVVPVLPDFKAFSSEVETGSREESA